MQQQQWMHSDLVYQERDDPKKGVKHQWKERKIIRSFGSDEKNGNLQPILLTPIDILAEHVYAPRAMPALQPNRHLMAWERGVISQEWHQRQLFHGPLRKQGEWSLKYMMDPLSPPSD